MKKNKLVSVLVLSLIFVIFVILVSCEFGNGNGNGNGFLINIVNSRYEEKLEKFEKILFLVIENYNFIENVSSVFVVLVDFVENVKLDLDSNFIDIHVSIIVDKINIENVVDLNKEFVKQLEIEIIKLDEISGEININSVVNVINIFIIIFISILIIFENNISSISFVNYLSNVSELLILILVVIEFVIKYFV